MLLSDEDEAGEPPQKKKKLQDSVAKGTVDLKGKAAVGLKNNVSVVLVPNSSPERQCSGPSSAKRGEDLSLALRKKDVQLKEMADELRIYEQIMHEKREVRFSTV